METTEINQVYRWGRIALIVLVVFLAIQGLNGLKDLREPSLNSSVITVTGEGEAFAIPDLATFSFSVSADRPTVEQAQGDVTKKMDEILAMLSNLGIEDRDIKTTDYSVWPKYVYNQINCATSFCPGRQTQDGYTVNHSVVVKVRDTEKAGEALSLVGSNGATNLSGISFTVDNPDAVMAEARKLAIEEAEGKAEILADDLGVKLVRIVSFSDGFDGGGIMPYRQELAMGNATDMAAKAPTLPLGENRVQANITITYEIR